MCRCALCWRQAPPRALRGRRNTATAMLHPVPGSNWPRLPAPLPRSKARARSTQRQPPYAYATPTTRNCTPWRSVVCSVGLALIPATTRLLSYRCACTVMINTKLRHTPDCARPPTSSDDVVDKTGDAPSRSGLGPVPARGLAQRRPRQTRERWQKVGAENRDQITVASRKAKNSG